MKSADPAVLPPQKSTDVLSDNSPSQVSVVGRGNWSRWGLTLLTACLVTGAWLEIVRLAHLTGLRRAEYLDAKVFNGDFQTFDPIRRWLSGEVLFRDFDVYLGIGPTLTTAVGTWLCGGDFPASLYAVSFLCLVLNALVLHATGRLCGLWNSTAALLALLLTQSTLISENSWLPGAFNFWYERVSNELATPSNSILAIRSVAGPLLITLLALTWRFWRPVTAQDDLRTALVIGSVGGFGLLWSNDSGIPLAGALTLALPLFWLRDRRWNSLARHTAIAVGTILLVATTLLLIATHGAILEWYRFNFQGVAKDQFWYFAGRKVLTIADFPMRNSGWIALLYLLWFGCKHMRSRQVERESLLWPLLAAAFLGSMLSQIAGSSNRRYELPLGRLLIFMAPALLLDMFAILRGRVLSRQRQAEVPPAVAPPAKVSRWVDLNGPRSLPAVELQLILLVWLAFGVLWARPEWKSAYVTKPPPAPEWRTFISPAPPGRLSNDYAKTIALGLHLRGEFEPGKVPPKERMFSTYVSYLDITTGAFNPTRHDQIIHALGRERRDRYLADLARSNVRYAVTSRRDKFRFEPWLRRVNWPIYEHILQNFDPVNRSDDCVLWRKRADKRRWIGQPFAGQANRVNESAWEITFEIPEADRKDLREKALVLVEFDYSATPARGARVRGLIQQYLDVFPAGVELSSGLPVGAARTAMAVDGLVSGTSRVAITLLPQPLSVLEIRNVVCTTLVPLELIEDIADESFAAMPFTDVNWRNGILRFDPNRVACAADELRHLRVGDELRFPAGGLRKIIAFEGESLRVDGPPLDFERDGFPNSIVVVNPQRRDPDDSKK